MNNLNEQDLAEMQENRNIVLLKRMLMENDVDEMMLWVECPSYQDEVLDVTDEDITDNNGRLVKHITFKFTGMGEPNVTGDLMEWKNLVEELSRKEVLLYHKKEAYQVASDKIIGETDFKALFGKNNADVRKNSMLRNSYALNMKLLRLWSSVLVGLLIVSHSSMNLLKLKECYWK